ncbi:MAG TPA: aldo/keto reductase [Nitrososphaerales archaeon]|nr:aldo/keto reductase [Nitrososphaerales archaeon]
MNYREFGKTSFKTSLVGMGTFYDAMWIVQAMVFGVQRGRKEKLEALRTGLQNGINFIDTTEIYRSESIVSEAVKGMKRDEIFIATKVWSNHLTEDALIRACKRSLERLGTSYVDLYQIHFPNSKVPLKETMGAMERLLSDGLIRAIGVSNFSLKEMMDAQDALGKAEIVSTQMNYNLAHRDIERDILPYCQREKIAVIAYYPLGHGKLGRPYDGFAQLIEYEKERPNLDVEKSHQRKDDWLPSQVALSWLFSRNELVFPIPRASTANHVFQDAKACDLVLSPEQIRFLEEKYPL